MLRNPIGILDSGSGGLSIWQAVTNLLSHESVIYIGDHAHLPYSEKETIFIQDRVVRLIKFLRRLMVKLVIIACNTGTVAGIDVYRKAFPKLPIIGVVPVVKTAAQMSKTRRFAVLSTTYTAQSVYQQELIHKFARGCQVFNLGCPNLVTLVEKGQLSGKPVQREVRQILKPLEGRGVDVIALGCTHYPFLRGVISDIVGHKVKILDSAGAVARQTHRVLELNQAQVVWGRPKYQFFTTGNARDMSQTFKLLLKRPVTVKQVSI